MNMTSQLRVDTGLAEARVTATKKLRAATPQAGREAILDRESRLFGYRLVGRPPATRRTLGKAEGAPPPPQVIDLSTRLPIDRVVDDRDVCLSVGCNALMDTAALPVDASRLILEVGSDVPANAVTCARLAVLHARGCRLAIDAERWSEDWGRVRQMFDVVRLDGDQLLRAGGSNDLRVLRAHGARLLAYGVETRAQFESLHALGVDLFQGFFFAHPELADGGCVGEAAADFLHLVSRIHAPGIQVPELVALISKDVSLSYRLLRFVNSPCSGVLSDVRSVEQAVLLLGLGRIRAWTTLLAMMGFKDKPLELCHHALVRAHMCERLARKTVCGDPHEAYTVGLLSVLEALLDAPMDRVLMDLRLSYQVTIAIARSSGIYGLMLESAVAVEHGDWDEARRVGVDPEQLAELHASATLSAFRTMKTLEPMR